MMFIGVDYHPSFQTIAYFVEETGEYDEQELNHRRTLWLHDDHRFGRKEPNMMFIGVDYHPSFQTIAYFVEGPGESTEHELTPPHGQTEKFYRGLKQRGICVGTCTWRCVDTKALRR